MADIENSCQIISEKVCEKRLSYMWYGSLFLFIFTRKITTKKEEKYIDGIDK